MQISRRTLLKAFVAASTGAATGGAAYGFLYERHAIEVTRSRIPVVGLPPALNGLTIGLITDTHRSSWVSDEDVQHAVQLLMAERPDLIVLGGDYVTKVDRRYMGPSAESLRGLSATHGVYAILGNHDDDHDMPQALNARGFVVLKDARTDILVNGETLNLIGIRFWTRRAASIAALTRGAKGLTVLLAHDPRRLTEAASLNIPLVLSGHTHGGQVVLPGVGAIAAQKFPVVQGTGRQNATTIFVSRGIGMVYAPIRINCPPEVALLTLQPAAA
ncbi:MAG: metallophosphoesterase [Acidobacteriaceae bacterium]|jgi:predicted MPP superfamily phosphohydrolase|nr:metallophosphoesterase [Acidobacteriaceae bacterium]